MTAKRYSFDDHPEHKAQLDEWAQRWIANAFSTEPADQERMRAAMTGLYEAANLEPPTRGVFVASPMTAAFAGTIAAAAWWIRDNPDKHVELFGRKVTETDLMAAVPDACARAVAAAQGHPIPWPTRAATDAATVAGTRAATDAATYAATDAATIAATDAATSAATYAATIAATRAATIAATRAATRAATIAGTRAATVAGTRAATDAATDVVRFMLGCTQRWYSMYDGGSDWSAWPSYLSFFRGIAKLDLPVYEKWQHYENAALYGAGRMLHPKFWIVSDRQVLIRLDAQRRLHAEHGPARAWADGWKLFYWHGTPLPADPDEIRTWQTDRILRERNTEVRRAMIEIIGWPAFIEAAQLTQIGGAVDDPGNPGQQLLLYDVPARIYDADVRVLVCVNATPEPDRSRHTFGITVPADITDPVAAAAWTFGVPADMYAQLEAAC